MPTVRYTVINGEVIAEKRGGTRKQYVPDAIGSTAALLNSSQTITDTYVYWPFGEVLQSSGSTPTPFTFVGVWGYHTTDANIFYVRARYYRPMYGSWMTADLLWPQDSAQAYAYADGNPTTEIDPSGNQAQCPTHGWWGKKCVFSGPPEATGSKAYWHCLDPYPPGPSPYDFWDQGFWGYGNCCGPTRKCGPGSKTYNCTDAACKAHDICVGPDIIEGIINWWGCNRRFCNDIKYCWNQHCVKKPWDGKQCAAIEDIAYWFCNSFGGGPPDLGNEWK